PGKRYWLLGEIFWVIGNRGTIGWVKSARHRGPFYKELDYEFLKNTSIALENAIRRYKIPQFRPV
ncbi:MAG: hypothetical protein ACHQJX_09945, partial [Candidatus Acidiferrales bacterium]